MKGSRYMTKRGFTLIEVMIALMILSIALLAFSQGQVVALNSARRTRLISLATIAGKNMMEEVKLMTELKGFEYVKRLDEKSEGAFEEELYRGWKWEREVREVVIPIAQLINILMQQDPLSGSEDHMVSEQEGFFGSGMESQIVSMLSQNVESIMKESLREITVRVLWPVRGGREFSSISIVYYVVDYNSLDSFVPSL